MVELEHPSYPRASRYDADWLLELDMGPNPLWLLEDLLADLSIRSGDRVLDLGCGRGATSVFLAREFGVEVCAVDLWVEPDVITATFEAASVADRVRAHHADVRVGLPFDDDAFDVIVCIDAWEYFGTDDRLLPSLLRVLRPGGQLGVATVGMVRDVRDLGYIPDHIDGAVGWEALTWHSPERVRQQWEVTGLVDVTTARLQETGWADWLRWSKVARPHHDAGADQVVAMLEVDGGELLSFAMLAARKR